MTDEQIKQNAEEYILPLKTLPGANEKITLIAAIREAFVEGALSRDEEIKELKEEIESLQEQYNTCFEGFTKRGTKLGELMKENVKLRNPWISVEDKLPKYCTVPSTEQYIKNKRYWDNKVAPIYLVICSDPQCGNYYQFANFLMFPEDKRPSWVFIEDDIKRNCVTHWMSIPELKKGE